MATSAFTHNPWRYNLNNAHENMNVDMSLARDKYCKSMTLLVLYGLCKVRTVLWFSLWFHRFPPFFRIVSNWINMT